MARAPHSTHTPPATPNDDRHPLSDSGKAQSTPGKPPAEKIIPEIPGGASLDEAELASDEPINSGRDRKPGPLKK
ncbi:MAG: hypothetical protein ACOH2I_14165 [Pseudomonas sp.]